MVDVPVLHGRAVRRDIATESGYDFLTVWSDEDGPTTSSAPPFYYSSSLDASPAGRTLASFSGYTYNVFGGRDVSLSGLRRVFVSFTADASIQVTGFVLRYSVRPTAASPPPPSAPPYTGPSGGYYPGGGGSGYYPGGGDGLPLCDSAFIMHGASYFTGGAQPGYITNDLAYRRRAANMTGDGQAARPRLPPLPFDAAYAGAPYAPNTNCSWLFFTPANATTTIVIKWVCSSRGHGSLATELQPLHSTAAPKHAPVPSCAGPYSIYALLPQRVGRSALHMGHMHGGHMGHFCAPAASLLLLHSVVPPPPRACPLIIIRYLDLEPGYDALAVTDLESGADLTQPLSESSDAARLPVVLSITSHAFAIRFTSDASVSYLGFALEYYVTDRPVAFAPPPAYYGPGYGPGPAYSPGSGGSPGYDSYPPTPGSDDWGGYGPDYAGEPQCDALTVVQGAGYYTNASAGAYITSDFSARRKRGGDPDADAGASAPAALPPLPSGSPYLWLPSYAPNTSCTWRFDLPPNAYATLDFV